MTRPHDPKRKESLMFKMIAGYGLTVVAHAMNVGYEWSLNDSVSSLQLDILKFLAIGAIPFVIYGLIWLCWPRHIGKVSRND